MKTTENSFSKTESLLYFGVFLPFWAENLKYFQANSPLSSPGIFFLQWLRYLNRTFWYRARYEDARFFYDSDCSQPLISFRDKLEGITFQVPLFFLLKFFLQSFLFEISIVSEPLIFPKKFPLFNPLFRFSFPLLLPFLICFPPKIPRFTLFKPSFLPIFSPRSAWDLSCPEARELSLLWSPHPLPCTPPIQIHPPWTGLWPQQQKQPPWPWLTWALL